MTYSSDEKTLAVSGLVQGTLSFQQDTLGALNKATQFSDVFESVYVAFLYDTDAIFYLTKLACGTLKRLVITELALCNELLGAVTDLAMPNRPLDSISGLASARNSLQVMDASLARSGSLSGAEYRRYQQALTRFKQQLGRVVRMTYTPRGSTTPVTDIVRPASKAKLDTASFLSRVVVLHGRFLTHLGYIPEIVPAFSQSKLTNKIGQRQLVRARDQLDDLEQKLEGLTAAERTAESRDALLTVLSNESVVKALARYPTPGTAKLQQSPSVSPLYRLSAHGVGVAPKVTGALSAPFHLYDAGPGATDMLGFLNLNGAPHTIDLFPANPSSMTGVVPAGITSSKLGDHCISVDLATPHPLVSAVETWNTSANGNIFHIIVDGVPYECTLTLNVALTAAAAKIDLDTVGNWLGAVRPAITVTVTGAGALSISYNVVVNPPAAYSQRHMSITQGFGYAQDLWPWHSGPFGFDAASRSAGWDQNNELWVKANDDPAHVVVTLPSGGWPDYFVDLPDILLAIDVAGGAEFTAETDAYGRLRIVSELSGEGSIITLLSGGVRPLGDSRVGYPTPSHAGLQELGFVQGQESREVDIDGGAVVAMLTRDAAFFTEASARLLHTAYLSGNNAVRSAERVLSIPLAANPAAAWPSYEELKIIISSGGNRGIYELAAAPVYAGGSLNLLLSRRLRDTTAGLFHTYNVYREVLELESKDASLSGVIELTDPIGSARTALGLDDNEHTALVGELLLEKLDSTYGWRALDVSRHKLRVGDVVLNWEGVLQATISSTSKLSQGILVVDPTILPTYLLSAQGFRLQSGAYRAYLAFVRALNSWVVGSLPPFDVDLHRLDRILAPLLVVTPSADRVDAAYAQVSLLITKLEELSALLDGFVVARVPAVDAALQALLEHGYDRARQLLLTGQIAAFFAATASDASFSKAFQQAANAVVVQDVNRGSRAHARFDSEFRRLRGSWEEDVHPDNDFSDLEDEPPDAVMIDYYSGVDGFEGT